MKTKVAIVGNTYPIRDALKSMGGTWDAKTKSWMVPAEKATEAQALLKTAPPRTFDRSFKGRESSSSAGRCRGCRGPITHAAHHRAMEGYCGSCAFDEFDQ